MPRFMARPGPHCTNPSPFLGASLRALLAAAALFAANAALAEVPGAASDAKVRDALARGHWVVAQGEGLFAICRRFFPDDPVRVRALRQALFERNPNAFINGNPNLIVVGARLRIPADLAKWAPGVLPSPAPPAMVAAPGPTRAAPDRAPASPAARADDPPPIPERRDGPAQTEAPAYVDRLIDESAAAQALAAREEEPGEEPLGRRSAAIDLKSEWRDTGSRRLLEHGIGLQYRRETAQWGDLGFEADLRWSELTERGATERDRGGKVTLYQYRFPVTGDWLADSAAGVLRSLPPNLVSTGFRVNLPAQLLWGAGTSFYTDTTRLYAQGGRGARLVGFSTQQVETDDSRSGVLGAEIQALPWLRLGAQANAFRLAAGSPDQASLALVAEARPGADRDRARLALLGDDERRKAWWIEGDAYRGFYHHRYGGYQFDRGVAYNALSVPSDERLAYLRTDFRTQRLTYALSLDVSQTNLDREPARAGHDAVAAFGSMNLRLSRLLSIGGSLNVRREDPRTPASVRKDVDAETAFLRVATELGVASFDLGRTSQRSPGLPAERSVALAWNHEWPSVAGFNLSTTLSRGEEDGLAGEVKRTLLGLTLRSYPLTGVYFDLNVVRARVDRPFDREDNVNASLGATWQFHPDWQAQLYAIWNTIETSLADAANPTFRDKSVQLNVRYQRSGGLPIVALGARQPGAAGTGRIAGRVFFDENDDGVRQPGERAAARVTLFLDGRFPVTSDAEGRFEFPLVTAGTHAIQVAVETIPLPWGLAEERSVPVAVPLRGEALVEIALKRIAPD